METDLPLKKPMHISSVVIVKTFSLYVIVYLGHGTEQLLSVSLM